MTMSSKEMKIGDDVNDIVSSGEADAPLAQDGMSGLDQEEQNDLVQDDTSLASGKVSYDENDLIYEEYGLTKRVDGIELSNIKVGKVHSNKCLFVADTANVSQDLHEAMLISIKAIDDGGNVRDKFTGVLKELAKGESGKLKVQVLADITYAVDFEFEVLE